MEEMKPPRQQQVTAVTGTKIVSDPTTKSADAMEANQAGAPEKLYYNFPRKVWIGGYIASITIFILNNVFTVLLFGAATPGSAGIVAYFYGLIIDIVILLPLFVLSYRGLQETKPEEPETKGSWNTCRLVFLSFIFYFGYLWAIQSYYKYAMGIAPVCPSVKDDIEPEAVYLQECSWDHHRAIFFTHAMTGPAVLMLECFNYMKLSRNVVTSIEVHRIVGRINNILVMVASVGAFGTALVTSTPTNTTSAFFILLAYWVPTMLLGWYFVLQGNIKQHMRFMTRHFTGTCAAITLRILAIFGIPYIGMVWGSLPQLFVIEIVLQRQDNCDVIFWKQLFGLPAPEPYSSTSASSPTTDKTVLVKADSALEKQ